MTAADPNWNNVTLLMHGEDFVDTKSQTSATLVGSPTIDPSTVLFGSGSIYCTAGNYVTFPDASLWDFGTAEFAIEFAVYFTTTAIDTVLIGQAGSGVFWQVMTDSYGRVLFRFYNGSSTYESYETTTTLSPGAWYRISVERFSTDTMAIYINGTRATNYRYNYNYPVTGSSNPLSIGSTADAYFDEIRITKGVPRRNGEYSYTLDTEPFPNADHPQYPVTVTDTIISSDATYGGPGYLLLDALAEPIIATDTMNTLEAPILDDAITVVDDAIWGTALDLIDNLFVSDSVAAITGTALLEAITAADAVAVQASFGLTLADAASALDSANLASLVTVSDAITLSWALGVVQGSTIAEQLQISEVLDIPIQYQLSITDTLRVYDALRNFFNFDLVENITVSEAVSNLARHVGALSESVTAAETLSPHFLLSATANDEAVLDDAFDIKMIFQPQVLEQIKISALLIEPNGGVTTWAVNTRTGAVTEYANYEFNSFAQNNRYYIGASSTGLYQLDGDDDAGEPIIAQLRSGYAQFGGSRYTSFKAAYLGLRGDGSVFLKLDTGDGKTYTYKSVVQDQQSTKVRFGKGLRARYFAFELISEGQDFDLDTIEFLPVVAQRRV